MAEIIALEQISKQYGNKDNSVTALKDVALRFEKGTFTAIMGPSGSGKSTLLQCAAGLDQPTTGKVMIDGANIASLSETERTLLRRNKIGFIFQSFNLVSALTAEENATLPLRLAGHKPDQKTVDAILSAVGLSERKRHRPAQLSGGQQQRVAIARALISRPLVIFADEPTGALDSTAGNEVLRLLRELVDQHQHTVIMVTHDPTAAAYADKVVFLADGQIVHEMRRAAPKDIAAQMTSLERIKG